MACKRNAASKCDDRHLEIGERLKRLARALSGNGELADLFERVTGRSFERRVWSVGYLRTELARSPDYSLRKYRAVFALGTGVAWDKTRTYNAEQGIVTTGAESWARDNLVLQP